MTVHTFEIKLHRVGEQEPIHGGHITFTGEDYDDFDETQALERIVPGGEGPETLDTTTVPGFIKWRGILMPASEFKLLEVNLISKGV